MTVIISYYGYQLGTKLTSRKLLTHFTSNVIICTICTDSMFQNILKD